MKAMKSFAKWLKKKFCSSVEETRLLLKTDDELLRSTVLKNRGGKERMEPD